MITIIEGADGCGKTTLAKSAAFADHSYHHSGPPKTDSPFREYFQRAVLATADSRPVLFDRFHLGERVWGPMFRDGDALGPVRMRMLERYLLSQRAVLVLCKPPYRVGRNNWSARAQLGEELMLSDTQYKAAYMAFAHLIHAAELPYVIVDPFTESPDAIRAKVEAIRPPKNMGPGIGAYAKGVTLLVGEQCNGPDFGMPFVADTGCSPWLAEQLENAGVREDDLYWINAHDLQGEMTDPAFIIDLKPTRIIALGNTAADWCRYAAGDEFCKVPHPQFWRRFKSKLRYPLLDLLFGSQR